MIRGKRRHAGFQLLAWGTLAFNVAVVLWGAYVRATGSGAGCGSHWPLCNGVPVPRSPSVETWIEFSHRVSSGLAFILVLALALWAWRVLPRGDRARKAAFFSLLFMVLEAIIGAGLVLFELVAENPSALRAAAGALHLANTFFLLASLALATSPESGRLRLQPRRGTYPILGTVVFLGMTGAVVALGDTIFRPATLSQGIAQELQRGAHFAVRMRVLHPLAAILAATAVVYWLRKVHPGEFAAERRLRLLSYGILLAQLAAGLLNVVLLAPIWLQLVHLALADALWIALVLYGFRAAPLSAVEQGGVN